MDSFRAFRLQDRHDAADHPSDDPLPAASRQQLDLEVRGELGEDGGGHVYFGLVDGEAELLLSAELFLTLWTGVLLAHPWQPCLREEFIKFSRVTGCHYITAHAPVVFRHEARVGGELEVGRHADVSQDFRGGRGSGVWVFFRLDAHSVHSGSVLLLEGTDRDDLHRAAWEVLVGEEFG